MMWGKRLEYYSCGWKRCMIEAAQRLALEGPEDAILIQYFLPLRHMKTWLAKDTKPSKTVAGVENRGVQADEKVASEIKSC
ncbi:MAG: hypothetical protein CM1200mP23_3260 [Nitrososphaerota archaeon]|nr:MAG: hypothetical protein CM1200mP23_3260 [Nitrososphaerota archaeon]